MKTADTKTDRQTDEQAKVKPHTGKYKTKTRWPGDHRRVAHRARPAGRLVTPAGQLQETKQSVEGRRRGRAAHAACTYMWSSKGSLTRVREGGRLTYQRDTKIVRHGDTEN
eukprot:Selendium_serpulae@DN5735_c1_g1_i2.p1